MSKLPAFMFYPGDWRKDPALSSCTMAAQGVWMQMLCLAFESVDRGVIGDSIKPWSDDRIARAVGGDLNENLRAIQELEAAGVFSRTKSGAPYCRRMIRDEQKRRLCAEAGKRGGGNPSLTYKGHPKGDSKGQSKGDPPPSVTVSVSSSQITTPEPSASGSGLFNNVPETTTVDPHQGRMKQFIGKEAEKSVNHGAGQFGMTFAMMLDIWFEEAKKDDSILDRTVFQKHMNPKQGLWQAVKDMEPLRYRRGVRKYLDNTEPFYRGHPCGKFIKALTTFVPMNSRDSYDTSDPRALEG